MLLKTAMSGIVEVKPDLENRQRRRFAEETEV